MNLWYTSIIIIDKIALKLNQNKSILISIHQQKKNYTQEIL